jgi:hypothetical protein
MSYRRASLPANSDRHTKEPSAIAITMKKYRYSEHVLFVRQVRAIVKALGEDGKISNGKRDLKKLTSEYNRIYKTDYTWKGKGSVS